MYKVYPSDSLDSYPQSHYETLQVHLTVLNCTSSFWTILAYFPKSPASTNSSGLGKGRAAESPPPKHHPHPPPPWEDHGPAP